MSRLTALRLTAAALLVSVLMGSALFASQRSAANMSNAAGQFLNSLSPEQRANASFAFNSDDRLRWHFIPNEMFPRKGLMLKDMKAEQRRLANALLGTGLSSRGLVKVQAIIELEDVLKVVEVGGKFARNKEEYLFSVFGTPGPKGAWGWRVEGHHISIRFTITDGSIGSQVASSPMFLGSNPAEVREGAQKGTRVLGEEEDAGRALMMALDPAQRTTATFNAVAPNEIVTTNQIDIKPLSPEGIKASAMTPAQRDGLMKVLDSFIGLMTPEIATDRMAKIKAAGIDNVAFAWAGPVERGQKHYYRVQGPTFLIEFDNTQNDGNHVHSIWRDFTDDFGRDLLREHVKASH